MEVEGRSLDPTVPPAPWRSGGPVRAGMHDRKGPAAPDPRASRTSQGSRGGPRHFSTWVIDAGREGPPNLSARAPRPATMRRERSPGRRTKPSRPAPIGRTSRCGVEAVHLPVPKRSTNSHARGSKIVDLRCSGQGSQKRARTRGHGQLKRVDRTTSLIGPAPPTAVFRMPWGIYAGRGG